MGPVNANTTLGWSTHVFGATLTPARVLPWFYGPLGALQDMLPNVFTIVLGRAPKAP